MLLLRQILWPPLIDGGHYQSKLWKTVSKERLKLSPSGRCIICGCQGEKTWHLFSVQRKGWRWRPIVARSTAKALQVHELVYSYTRSQQMTKRQMRRWLKLMCPTHHAALHRFDKALLPWDRRNRWLWLTSLIYIASWYFVYALCLSPLGLGALYLGWPTTFHHLITAVTP